MSITLTQTDTNSDLSTNTAAASPCYGSQSNQSSKVASSGGTAGTVAATINTTASAAGEAEILFAAPTGTPLSTSWEGGSAIFRLEVTTANMNVTWVTIQWGYYAAGVGATIDCFSALGISLGATGVQSTTKTVSASSGRSVTDRMIALYGFSNSAMSTSAWAMKPSQNIDTPVIQGVSDSQEWRGCYPPARLTGSVNVGY